MARQLADATGEPLVSMADHRDGTFGHELRDDERIGICFPVHGWRPPRLVRDFVRHLSLMADGHYVYAVCTAGDTIGETIDILERDLAEAGLHLDAAFSVIMPNTYVGLPFMDVDGHELESRKKAQATEDLRRFVPDIVARRQGVRQLTPGRWPRINSRLLGAAFVGRLITDKPFRVDSARCVKCGICADVCPVGDIRGGLGFEPEWLHTGECLTCFACYHHCPHHAIDYGNRTAHKGQYFYKRLHQQRK